MKVQNAFTLFLLYFITTISFAQAELNQNKQKLETAFMEFFKLDRENIHLHLNKNTYLNTDEIWFKGYVIEKKSRKPYVATSNVNISLIDDKGEKLKNYLFYADNSVFEGSLNIDKNLKTGTYYLQAYTNYMNNFAENESNFFEIKIINPEDGNVPSSTNVIDYSTITTEFFPEGSVFLEGTSNTIGIKITDCNGNGVPVKDGEIKDAQGITITNFTTNEFGHGKFDILQTKNELYKAVYLVDDIKIEKALPLPIQKGITFSVNNYTFENKTTIKIKTNTNSINEYKNTPLTLVLQQNNEVSFVDFSFKENTTEHLLVLPSNEFSEGINTIYLTNSNFKKLAERVIYTPSKFNKSIALEVNKKTRDSVSISGKSNIVLGSISISVLPNETKSLTDHKDIYRSLILDNHLSTKTPKGSAFLSNFSKRKHYELDSYLLSKKSKYDWQSILSSPPNEKFDFDHGLTFKGTINKALDNKNAFKVQMYSITSGLEEFSEINDKNEFYFKNILVTDSTTVHFSLIDQKERKTEIKLFTQILNNNRPFIKPFNVEKTNCPASTLLKNDNLAFPRIANTIQLDSLTLNTTKKKTELSNVKRFNNSMAKGFKITEADASRDLLQFISSNGFDVIIQGATVIINGRKSTSFLGSKSPAIFIDDVPLRDFNQLLGYTLQNVDEIYINKSGYGGGMEATNGIIRVYTKKGFGGVQKIKINSQSFVVKNGFQKLKSFKNPKYTSHTDEGFINFGTIHWEPYVETDENGQFSFSIPNYNQKTVKIIIEGIASDGQLISEIKTIEIP